MRAPTSIFRFALTAAIAILASACSPRAVDGCSPDDAAAQVERLSRDLAQARQTGRLDDGTMNQVASRMAEAGKFYSETQDSNKYCADIAEMRAMAGLAVAAKP